MIFNFFLLDETIQPQFCCKEAQFLHWAEPYLNGYGTLEEGTRTIAYNPFDDSRTLTPMEQILAQSERKGRMTIDF